MKEKIFRMFFTFLIIGIVLFQFTFLSKASTELSNNLLAWGLKRNENHAQPTLDANSLKILNEFNRYIYGKL